MLVHFLGGLILLASGNKDENYLHMFGKVKQSNVVKTTTYEHSPSFHSPSTIAALCAPLSHVKSFA